MNGVHKALRLWPWLAAIGSGLLQTACFAPFNQTWLCWIALTPLLAAILFSGENSKHRWLRDLLLGYVCGLAFFWTVLSWVTTVTVPGWFLLQFYMALYFAPFGWFCGLLRPRPLQPVDVTKSSRNFLPSESPLARSPWLRSTYNLRLAFLMASAWTTLEWLRGWVFTGWGWNGLGTALHANPPIIQIAEFTGVAGLSFMVAFANVIAVATVRRFILETQVRPVKPHFDLTLTMVAIVAVMGFGVHALQLHPPTKTIRVAAVQANIPREEKFTPAFRQKIFDQFTRLTTLALQSNPPPDLIVWPESSMPGPVLEDEESYRYVANISASAKVDLLLGAIDEDIGHAYNAALLISNGGEAVQIYRKLHLVPFGEYIPGRHVVPLLARIIGDQVPGDFDAGDEYTVFRLTKSDTQVAPLICFEDTIGDLTRRFVLGGANLLANVTNDGWFLRSAGSQQHLASAIFRCVETRRPMVRAANTGVTCFVDQFGRLQDAKIILPNQTAPATGKFVASKDGSQFTDGVLSGEVAVPTERELTFYVRHGELFAQCCAGVTVITLFLILVRLMMRRQNRKGSREEPVQV